MPLAEDDGFLALGLKLDSRAISSSTGLDQELGSPISCKALFTVPLAAWYALGFALASDVVL